MTAEISLINLTKFPPGGYKYREPSINWVMPSEIALIGLDDAVRALQMARANNPSSGLDPSYSACLEAIKKYTCTRLNNDPRWCDLPPEELQKRSSIGMIGRPCAGCGRR